MKNILLIITIIMSLQEIECSKSSDKIYKYISSDNIEEFIKLPNKGNGIYYGAEKTVNKGYIYFVADIIIEKMDNEGIKFTLSNYKYSKTTTSPYKQSEYFVPDEKALGVFNLGTLYFGKIGDDKLILNRQKIYYDSATDHMTFILEK